MASMHIYTVGQRCAQLLRFSSYNPHHGLYPSSSFLAYIHSWPKVCPAPQLFTFTEGHAPIIAGRPSITRNVGLPYATSLGGLAGLRYPRHLAGHTAQSSPEGSNSSLTFSQHHPVVRRVTGRCDTQLGVSARSLTLWTTPFYLAAGTGSVDDARRCRQCRWH